MNSLVNCLMRNLALLLCVAVFCVGAGHSQAWSQNVTAGTKAPAIERNGASVAQTGPGANGTTEKAVESDQLKGPIAEVISRTKREILALKDEMAKINAELKVPDLKPDTVEALRSRLETVRAKSNTAQDILNEPLANLTQQLKGLGAPPKEGETESEAIAAERARLSKTVNLLEGGVKQLGIISTEASQVSTTAASQKREDFFKRIFTRSKSVLNPASWYIAVTTGWSLIERGSILFHSWHDASAANDSGLTGATTFYACWAIVLIGLIALQSYWRYWAPMIVRRHVPNVMRRLLRAVVVIVISILITMLAGGAIKLIFSISGLSLPRVERFITEGLLIGLLVFTCISAIVRSIFSARSPAWRLVNVDDGVASKATFLGTALAAVSGINIVLGNLGAVMFLTTTFPDVLAAITAIMQVILIASIVSLLRNATPNTLVETAEGENARIYYFIWTNRLYLFTSIVLMLSILALILGYLQLGYFLSRQIIGISLVVSGIYLLHRMVEAIIAAGLDEHSPTGNFLRHGLSLSEKSISRFGVIVTTANDLIALLIGIPIVLAQWALTWVDFKSWAFTAFFGFKIGDIIIRPSSILLALLILIIGLIVVRLFTRWLENRILARTAMDPGVRNSIKTGASYAAILLVIGIALTAVGLDFSNLAIVAGALSLGIGFGLQSIVNNFVSGLILLAERPIKVGDWIVVNGGEGIVKKINVRSTEIETFDRCSVIVPNSSLISDTVQNWYHNDVIGRVRLPIGVSYNADPDKVREILLDCAGRHERALAFPEPFVLFMDFGASSLDFELRVYIDDVAWVGWVGSDLRFEIFKELKNAGIEIPFPQRDVHVRTVTEGFTQKPAPATKRKTIKKRLTPKGVAMVPDSDMGDD